MDKEDEPRSLKEIFADADSKRLSLEQAHDTTSDSYTETVSAAVKGYQDCLRLINTFSIFSPNETLEDISTSDLPYLLINFHLAELTQKLPSASPQERKRTLSSARDSYERYLHLLDSYELLPQTYKKLLEQYTESPSTFSTVSTSDPAARRNSKMANYKAEKELRVRLSFLRSQPEYANFDNPDTATANTGADEEAVRDVHLAHLNYSSHMTFQSLEGLNRELDVLALAPEPLLPSLVSSGGGGLSNESEDDPRRRERERANEAARLDMPLRRLQSTLGGPLLTKQGKPLQPFTLVNDRQELTKGVFRPGHNLPTMSIDEYLEEERRRGGIIEGGGEASWARPEPDEDDIDKADAETLKARAWDEYVEANPKGSGNTLNRG
ncbi:TAP42-like protein [Apodospora peruviana]|uniref:TAP42-like protein n=1 Tax=Apodospora peruviana TaxID=516989 RepID=A0AAE0I5A6_9PEZI|nr:TAP42-like protein [Apodospora peruviana]